MCLGQWGKKMDEIFVRTDIADTDWETEGADYGLVGYAVLGSLV